MSDDRWLVVGLGNPDDEYGKTRHNAGADAVRVVAGRHGRHFSRNRKVRCEIADVRVDGQPISLAIPESYMNRSGGPVAQAAKWLKVPADRVVIVHDDIDLAFGRLRLKSGGGHGGHNGLRDIERALGTRDWPRIRIGIGRPPGRMDPADYVLRPFTAEERGHIDVTIEAAADAIEDLVRDGLASAQQRHHAASSEEP